MRSDIDDVLAGRLDAICIGPDAEHGEHSSGLIFPGSFNPLHLGHRRMAQVAARRCASTVEFEISVTNVDKPSLALEEIQQRLEQFSAGTSVWLSRAATFVEKAHLFPGATMIIGSDTALRLGVAQYYGSDAARDEALAILAELDCRFLVFGRLIAGRFQTLDDLNLPSSVATLCDAVPEKDFRDDTSSSMIRGDL